MDWISDPQAWIGLLTLTVLEIVLGIDNIIFISILSSKLPREDQARARRLGLLGAFFTRILLLLSIAWIVRLTTPLFTIAGFAFSGRSLILLIGGLFLIGKATYEIHDKLEGNEHAADATAKGAGLTAVVIQIMLVDIIFSLDSVITAVGMVSHVQIMIGANVIALGVMLIAATPISDFVDKHPTIKILALSFLVLIGTNLVAESLGQHIPKGYTYFAMAFSFLVEMINLRLRARVSPPVRLHDTPRATAAYDPGARAATPSVLGAPTSASKTAPKGATKIASKGATKIASKGATKIASKGDAGPARPSDASAGAGSGAGAGGRRRKRKR